MKLFAATVAVATLITAAPAFADGDNPVTNAIKDHQMMTTGRYELPGQRSYDAAVARRMGAYNDGYGYSDGYYAPRYTYVAPTIAPAPAYGGPFYADTYEPVYGGGLYVGGGRFEYID